MFDLPPENPLLDEKLAEFTDRVLRKDAEDPQPSLAADEELHRLEQVIVQVKQACPPNHLDAKYAAHLRETLQKEWQRSDPQAAPKPVPPAPAQTGVLQKIQDAFSRIFPVSRGGQIAIFEAALLLLILVLLLPERAPLVGAAGANIVLSPVEFGIGIVCLSLLAWLILKKRD